MTIIEQLRTAIDNYETDNCETTIVDFAIEPGGGSVLQVGETFQFKVRVRNQSHLDMTNVTLRAYGTPYADVALSSGSFGSYATSAAFNLDAHQVYTTGIFRGRAKAVTGGSKEIVLARINSWDANLQHMLTDHTGAGVKEGKLSKDIGPN